MRVKKLAVVAFLGLAAAGAACPAGLVNYGNGFSNHSGLTANGNAKFVGSKIQLTNGQTNEASSVFTNNKVNIQDFKASFDFQMTGDEPMADGITFAIQSDSSSEIGQTSGGGNLAYTGMPNSAAVKFDTYQNGGDPSANSTGLFQDGTAPFGGIDLTGTNINLHDGDIFHVTMKYNGTALNVKITDDGTHKSFDEVYALNLVGAVGGDMAYVGFTGATGADVSCEDILNFKFSSCNPCGNNGNPGVQSVPLPSAAFSGMGMLAVLAGLGGLKKFARKIA